MAGVRILSKSQCRSIFSTAQVHTSWMEKVKASSPAKRPLPVPTNPKSALIRSRSSKARRVGAFKQYIVVRSSEATFSDAFEKQEAIIRCLAGFDPTGENLQTVQKQEAAKHCNCTISDVENALSKFTWAKEAQKKIEKLKEEGKPMLKSIAEVQKLVGSSPLDLARSNWAKSGTVSRNALCHVVPRRDANGAVERIEVIQKLPIEQSKGRDSRLWFLGSQNTRIKMHWYSGFIGLVGQTTRCALLSARSQETDATMRSFLN